MTATSSVKIEPLQIWFIGPGDPKPMRRIKILARHPEWDGWIYQELEGGIFRGEVGRLGVFPGENLRFMESKNMAGVEK